MAPCSLIKIAIAQTASGADKLQNIARATALVREAADTGAAIVALPETFDFRGDSARLGEIAEPLPGTAIGALMVVARERGIWVLAGSVHERHPDGGRPYNTSVLITPTGDIAATYRKIHLFDITIGGKSVAESAHYTRGNEIVCATAAGVKVGLSICYDMRFPELYRRFADVATDLIFIPSSFTTPTGAAHWEVLIRARAIENQCFVAAPGQAGIGAGGIPTYGNSMVVDPWGRVLARAGDEGEQVISATLDFDEMAAIRERLPALHNRKLPVVR
ncbi:MAG: carbon-nitrogen hydrolase family protein [Dehalococcoidia bacterium]|jgi:predicted amidohydrolase|nr:carbon-nitrogen hydrolase family protein [Dehalococcoidia bacterium]